MTRSAGVIATAVAVWTALWFAPWQPWIAALPWLQCAIAMALFCLPGFCLHLLLDGERQIDPIFRLPAALLFSAALAGVLGFVGSVVGLPTWSVSVGMWAAGSLTLALLRLRSAPALSSRSNRSKDKLSIDGAVLALVMVVTARLCLEPSMGEDELHYVARITSFQQSATLGFRDIALGGELLIPPRDWLAFWPLCEARISSLSGLHGLMLTSIYLKPLLAALSVLGVFALARTLGFARRWAILGVAAQTCTLLWLNTRDQPGRPFFGRIVEDKFLALYVFGPVVICLVTRVFQRKQRRDALAALALGWVGVALTHPTSLGILSLIVCAYCVLEFIATRRREALLALALVVPISAAAASVRFIPSKTGQAIYVDVDTAAGAKDMRGSRARRVDAVTGTRFYGIGVHSAPRFACAVGVFVLGLALVESRRRQAARYVAAGLGVAALAIVPYTGWIIGHLLTPFHLWRILAAVPFGIAFAFAAEAALAGVASVGSTPRRLIASIAPFASLLTATGLLATIAYAASNPRAFRLTNLRLPDGWSERVEARAKFDRKQLEFEFVDLLAMARELEAAGDHDTVVLGGGEINNLIPSLSSQAIVVVFRSPEQMAMLSGVSREEAKHRWKRYKQLVRGKMSTDEAVRYMRNNDVKLVLTAGPSEWFTSIPSEALPRQLLAAVGTLRLFRLEAPA